MDNGRFALIVASSHYSDTTLTQLQAPAHDAASLAAVLGTEAIGGFQVETLADQPARTVMQEIETFFDGRRREDLVLLYFSGHGILDEGARLYFATTDTRVDRPRSTAVPAAFVNDVMSECRSRRQVLVLDCCNSGSFARGIKAGGKIGTAERFEGRGRVVITASDALHLRLRGREDRGRSHGVGLHAHPRRRTEDGRGRPQRRRVRLARRALRLRLRARPRRLAATTAGQVGVRRRGPDPDRTHHGGGSRRTGGCRRASELPHSRADGETGRTSSTMARTRPPARSVGRRGDHGSRGDRRRGDLPADEG